MADDDKMRSEIKVLLRNVDLASTSIGKLRASLESALGLSAGALDARKEHVNKVLQNELVKKIQDDKVAAQLEQEKKRKLKADAENESAKKKEKKDGGDEKEDKRDKKDKKDRKDKKDEKDEKPKKDEGGADEAAPVAEEAAKPAPKAEEQDGMAMFEDFSVAESRAAAPKAVVTRSKTWCLSGAEDGNLRLWDLEGFSCMRVIEGHTGTVRCVDVDWESMQALSGADDNMRLWNLKNGGCQKTFKEVEDGCTAVAGDWKDNKALGGCGDGCLKLWDMNSGELLKSIDAHPGGVWAVEAAWSKRRVASGGDEHFKVWDTDGWACLHKIEGHHGGIMSLSVDWEGSRALIGSGSTEQSLVLWDLETRGSRNLMGHRDAVAHVCPDWDNEVVLSAGWDAQLRVWSLKKGSCTYTHEVKFGRLRSIAVDFAQMQAVCGSSAGTLHFVDLHSGVNLRTLEGHIGAVTTLWAKF